MTTTSTRNTARAKSKAMQVEPRLRPLYRLLIAIKKKHPDKVDESLRQLSSFVDDYKIATLPIRSGLNRPEHHKPAQTRKELATLAKQLRKAGDLTAQLSVHARVGLMGELNRNSYRTHSEFVAHIQSLADTVDSAIAQAKENAPDDRDTQLRKVLCWRVGEVLQDVLGTKVTSTRHTHPKYSGARDGAAYSRVLEQVLLLALGRSTGLERDLRDGLKLLKDPDHLPHPPKPDSTDFDD